MKAFALTDTCIYMMLSGEQLSCFLQGKIKIKIQPELEVTWNQLYQQ